MAGYGADMSDRCEPGQERRGVAVIPATWAMCGGGIWTVRFECSFDWFDHKRYFGFTAVLDLIESLALGQAWLKRAR